MKSMRGRRGSSRRGKSGLRIVNPQVRQVTAAEDKPSQSSQSRIKPVGQTLTKRFKLTATAQKPGPNKGVIRNTQQKTQQKEGSGSGIKTAHKAKSNSVTIIGIKSFSEWEEEDQSSWLRELKNSEDKFKKVSEGIRARSTLNYKPPHLLTTSFPCFLQSQSEPMTRMQESVKKIFGSVPLAADNSTQKSPPGPRSRKAVYQFAPHIKKMLELAAGNSIAIDRKRPNSPSGRDSSYQCFKRGPTHKRKVQRDTTEDSSSDSGGSRSPTMPILAPYHFRDINRRVSKSSGSGSGEEDRPRPASRKQTWQTRRLPTLSSTSSDADSDEEAFLAALAPYDDETEEYEKYHPDADQPRWGRLSDDVEMAEEYDGNDGASDLEENAKSLLKFYNQEI